MLAVATSAGNSGIADGLIGNYEDLIAAKYAEVYLRRATTDLLAAIAKFQMLADSTTQDELKRLVPDILAVAKDAKEAVALAYRQTTSTYNIAQEVGHMERALNANMSQTLKTSMAFGRSLR
jgi:conjugative transfer pilus assembly protein TraH